MCSLLFFVAFTSCQDESRLALVWFQHEVKVCKHMPNIPEVEDLGSVVDGRLADRAEFKLQIFRKECGCDAAQLAELQKLALRWKSDVRREVTKLLAEVDRGGEDSIQIARQIANRINSQLRMDPYRNGTLAKRFIGRILTAEQNAKFSEYAFRHDDQILFDWKLGLTGGQVEILAPLIAETAAKEDRCLLDCSDFFPLIVDPVHSDLVTKALTKQQRDYIMSEVRALPAK
ncbi:MAG: hypothetical protein AAGG44_03975 [Planctomycetota bacterium]